jgi:hypothetical protein
MALEPAFTAQVGVEHRSRAAELGAGSCILILSPAAKILPWSNAQKVGVTTSWARRWAFTTARCSTSFWLTKIGSDRMG